MAILIQKKAGIVNIIETTFDVDKQIIGTLSLDCVAFPIHRPSPEISVVQIKDEHGKPNRKIKFIPSLEVQDEGGAAAPFAGTLDDLINKLNNEYFVTAGSGGTPPLPTDASTKTEQLEQLSHSEKLLIGSTIDLTKDDGEEWGDTVSYPFTLDSDIAIRITVGTKTSSFESSALIEKIEDLIEEVNNKQTLLLFGKVDPTTLLVNDGDETVDSTTSVEFVATTGELSYPKPGISWGELSPVIKSAIQDFNERSKDILSETRQSTFYLKEVNSLLKGGNFSTSKMPTDTQATSPGTLYMMRTIRAISDTTILLKDLDVITLTNDSAFICIAVNPTINNPGGITYSPISGATNLEQGTIGTDNPTIQTMVAGTGDFKWGGTISGNTSLPRLLNLEIHLDAGDVLFYAINPDSLGLDASMYQSYLFESD